MLLPLLLCKILHESLVISHWCAVCLLIRATPGTAASDRERDPYVTDRERLSESPTGPSNVETQKSVKLPGWSVKEVWCKTITRYIRKRYFIIMSNVE